MLGKPLYPKAYDVYCGLTMPILPLTMGVVKLF